MDASNSHNKYDLIDILRTRVLAGLDTSQSRNKDRYLGTVPGLAETLSLSSPFKPDDLKALENAFATFHEQVVTQSIQLITWGVAAMAQPPRDILLSASDAVLEAAIAVADRDGDEAWLIHIAPMAGTLSLGTNARELAALHDRLRARNQATDLWSRKGLFDSIMTSLYQRDLREAAINSAEAAAQTGKLTKAMVIATVIIAVATVLQAISTMGFFKS